MVAISYPKEFKKYLKSSFFIDSDNTGIKSKALEVIGAEEGQLPMQKAIKLFYFVRDEIKYVVKMTIQNYNPHNTKASSTLKRGYGYCIQKAILLAAMLRSVEIPAKLHFVDIRNHKTPEEFIKMSGSNLFIYHSYPEIYLNDNWVAGNAAFDKYLSAEKGYPLVEFDGQHPALFAKVDSNGQKFIEYEKDHGKFAKVPYLRIIFTWIRKYNMKNFLKANKKSRKKHN
jgi:transglutaminase superfamily protein